ncbi:MAG: ATP-binding protein [Endomicrobiales bacterium]
MKREVITINEEKCNGCGLCIPNCPEGALQVINGKVRLISDLFCDGLGACIGHCPQGAISMEKREAQPYDEKKVMKNIVRGGKEVVRAHLKHLRDHGQKEFLAQAQAFLEDNGIEAGEEEEAGCHSHGHGGCPGARTMDLRKKEGKAAGTDGPAPQSQLRQWPVQLQLLNPQAPYFRNADLVVAADCVPFAFADFHRQFLKGRMLIIFCPKLDQVLDQYVEKLAELFRKNEIRSIAVVHMEVPCCFGVGNIVQEALDRSGKKIPVTDHTITIDGEIR